MGQEVLVYISLIVGVAAILAIIGRIIKGYEDFPIPSEWERFCVFDWGFARPFSVGWYAVDYDGIIFRYREWYGSKREHEQESERWDQGLKLQAWEVAKGILESSALS